MLRLKIKPAVYIRSILKSTYDNHIQDKVTIDLYCKISNDMSNSVARKVWRGQLSIGTIIKQDTHAKFKV
jgi:hypothetical protein